MALIVAIDVLAEDPGAKVWFIDRRLRLQEPAVGEGVDQRGLEAGVDACLSSKLAIVVHHGVEWLGQIAGVVCRKHRVAVGIVPASASQVLAES